MRKFDTSSKKKKTKKNMKTHFLQNKNNNSKKSICELKVPFFTLNSPLLTRHVTCSDTEIRRKFRWSEIASGTHTIPNYFALRKTRKVEKEVVCIYVHKSLGFNFRERIDICNESVETLSTEILSNKYVILQLRPSTVLPKEIKNYLKIFAKTF